MTEEFLRFLEELIKAAPEVAEKNMTESIKTYIDFLYASQKEKTILTENGKEIMKFLQDHPDTTLWSSKDVAYALRAPSRGIAAGFRKLVEDGYVEKIGLNPVKYVLTNKGKELKIN